jgi:hypothetical protein
MSILQWASILCTHAPDKLRQPNARIDRHAAIGQAAQLALFASSIYQLPKPGDTHFPLCGTLLKVIVMSERNQSWGKAVLSPRFYRLQCIQEHKEAHTVSFEVVRRHMESRFGDQELFFGVCFLLILEALKHPRRHKRAAQAMCSPPIGSGRRSAIEAQREHDQPESGRQSRCRPLNEIACLQPTPLPCSN